jgi:subtilase family serine protease
VGAAAASTLVAGLALTGIGVRTAPGPDAAPDGAAASPPAGLTVHPDAIYLNVARREQPWTNQQCEQQVGVNCYTPAQIQQAYSLPALYRAGLTGQGTTIVLVDAYGSPTMASDLSEFDSEANVPASTLNILQPVGQVPSYDQSNAYMVGWAQETTLDVEWAHVIAPGATIDLVEVPNGSGKDLTAGVQYAINHRLGDVISQSWGDAEQDIGKRTISDLHKVYAASVWNHVTVVAAAGDQGATQPYKYTYYNHRETLYSATDPDVVAVGGTNLKLDQSGNRTAPDTVWNDTYSAAVNQSFNESLPPVPMASGGGYSIMFRRPSYQRDVKNIVGGWRGVPDISMSASCSGSVQVYQSFPPGLPGWNPVCGTSEAAPAFAGIVALADQKAGHSLGFINPVIYQLAADHAKGIVQVTSGNNTVAYSTGISSFGQTITVRGYYARHGYSLVAGVGTIDGKYFVPELARGLVSPPGKGKTPPKKPVKKKKPHT